MIRKRFLNAGFFRGLTGLTLLMAGLTATSVASAAPVVIMKAESSSVATPAGVTQQASIKSIKVAKSLLQDIGRAGDRLVAVGERGHIIFSDDSGKTWQQAAVPTRQMLNAVFFVTPEKGWAVGYDGLVLNTVDGGKNWMIQLDGLKYTRERSAAQLPVLEKEKTEWTRTLTDAKTAQQAAEEAEKEDISVEEDAVDAAQNKLDDIDESLDDARAALKDTVAHPLMDVWFRDENHGFAVGAFGEFLGTKDGGVTWEALNASLDNKERSHLNAVTGVGNVVFIVGEAGHIFRSTDAGESWALLESPDPENGSFFAVNVDSSGNQIMVSGLRGAMYRSSNQGNTWKQIDESLHKNMNAVFFGEKEVVLAVGNDGAFLRSRDAGRTFKAHIQEDRLTIASVIEAADGNYVLVGAGGIKLIVPASL